MHSLEISKDLFNFKEYNEKLFDLEVSYPNVIGVLMHLENYIRSNILFFVNLLKRYGFLPTHIGVLGKGASIGYWVIYLS